MTTVYILVKDYGYDGQSIAGVYSSKEKGDAEIEWLKLNDSERKIFRTLDYYLEQHELDEKDGD